MSQYKKALWTIAVKGLVKAEEKQLVIAQGQEPRVGEWVRLEEGGGGQKQRQSSSDLAQSNASTLAAQNWVQRLCCWKYQVIGDWSQFAWNITTLFPNIRPCIHDILGGGGGVFNKIYLCHEICYQALGSVGSKGRRLWTVAWGKVEGGRVSMFDERILQSKLKTSLQTIPWYCLCSELAAAYFFVSLGISILQMIGLVLFSLLPHKSQASQRCPGQNSSLFNIGSNSGNPITCMYI